jgi:hypothetical protein
VVYKARDKQTNDIVALKVGREGGREERRVGWGGRKEWRMSV